MTSQAITRPDFSHSLVHLTRERSRKDRHFEPRAFQASNPPATVSAFSVLKEILRDGKIVGSGNEGFVKGTRRAVCLSEIPLSNVRFYAEHGTTTARYRFYGVAVSKRAIFEQGGRPVIYLPDKEGKWIPDDQKWRHVRFELPAIDFTHEREWRVPGDLNLATLPGVYVLVWSSTEADTIRRLTTPLENVRGILPMEHLNQML